MINVFLFLFLQIGSLKNYYLFHHNHISKRSIRNSELHHDALNSEPEVCTIYFIVDLYFKLGFYSNKSPLQVFIITL